MQKLDSKFFNRIIELYRVSRPILLVLMLAALIVFINSYPSVPDIAESTNDYRQQIKSKTDLNDTEQDSIKIKPPESPSLPNTITPFISPEDVNEITNPAPKPSPKPKTENDTDETPLETSPAKREPPLEIKLLTGFLNVAPLILIAVFGGFGIYLLFKYKKHFTLRSMFGAAIAIVAICTIIFFTIIAIDFTEFLYNIDINLNFMVLGFLPIVIVLGSWLSYNIISKRTTVFKRNIGLAFAGALMGAFLAAFLPFWIIFILLIAITLFDIYSVKFGPIKKIMELDNNTTKKMVKKQVIYRTLENPSASLVARGGSTKTKAENTVLDSNQKNITDTTPNNTNITTQAKINEAETNKEIKESKEKPEQKPRTNKLNKRVKKNDDDFDLMLMFDNPDWSLGLGDFVIYSMFTSAVLTYCLLYLPYYIFYSPLLGLVLPWVIFILCALSLLIGFFITLKLLQTRDYLPGLPISISFGFIVFIICITILQLINYILFNEFAIII